MLALGYNLSMQLKETKMEKLVYKLKFSRRSVYDGTNVLKVIGLLSLTYLREYFMLLSGDYDRKNSTRNDNTFTMQFFFIEIYFIRFL